MWILPSMRQASKWFWTYRGGASLFISERPTSYQATETFNSVVYNHTVTVTVLITKTNEYDKLQNSIKLFPNPNAGIVNLKWDDVKNGEAKVIVFDITGKAVFDTTLQITNGLSNFNLNLSPGTFLVKIINPHTNMIVNKKLMIR